MSTFYFFQQLPADKPVRNETQQPETPPPSGPAAPAPSEPMGGFGMMLPLLLLLPLFLILMWSSRSQQKKQEKALSELKKGDRVLTQSGLVGKLLETGERYARVEIAPGVKVEVLRTHLLGKDTGDNVPEKK